jgi:hypothetical protein
MLAAPPQSLADGLDQGFIELPWDPVETVCCGASEGPPSYAMHFWLETPERCIAAPEGNLLGHYGSSVGEYPMWICEDKLQEVCCTDPWHPDGVSTTRQECGKSGGTVANIGKCPGDIVIYDGGPVI